MWNVLCMVLFMEHCCPSCSENKRRMAYPSLHVEKARGVSTWLRVRPIKSERKVLPLRPFHCIIKVKWDYIVR